MLRTFILLATFLFAALARAGNAPGFDEALAKSLGADERGRAHDGERRAWEVEQAVTCIGAPALAGIFVKYIM